MKKLLFSVAALCLAANAAVLPEASRQKAWRPTNKGTQQKAVAAVPKILNEKMVVCGNKKLLLSHDGKIVLSNSSSMIATIFPFASYVFTASGKSDWAFTDSKKCKVRFEDGKVIWDLMKTHNGKTFKVADQTLELMPDGILRLSGKFYEPACDDQKLRRNGSFFIQIPFAGNEGRKVIFNDEENLTVTKSLRHGKWNAKKFKYEVFAGSPSDTFTLSAAKPESNLLTVLPVGKSFRFSCDFSKNRTGALYIDLRKSGVENTDSANTGAGVDFKLIEDLELPHITKNIMMNSSFEQNLLGWTTIYGLIGRGEFNENITGGGRGIGFGLSTAFAKAGAKLVITGRTEATLLSAKEKLETAYGSQVLTVAADGADEAAIQNVIDKTVEKFGRIDAVINNAQASASGKMLVQHTKEDLDLAIYSGIYATFFYMQKAYPHLKASKGCVINFASGAGLFGRIAQSSYAAAKEGIRGLSRVAATEWLRERKPLQFVRSGV